MKGIFTRPPILGLRRWIVVCSLLLICGTYHAVSAQSSDCPADKVCISREAALRALADSDTVKADAVAIAGYKQAIDDLKAELNKMRVEFANVSGENSGLRQAAVRTDAIIDVLLKNSRKKCMPFSVCF